MDHQLFEKYIEESIHEVPEKLRSKISNVAFVIEDSPRAARATEKAVKAKGVLLGLYQGVPLSKRGANYGNVLPDKITLFKGTIERLAGNDSDSARKLIRDVVHHEIGYYFGMSETHVRLLEHKRRSGN